MLSFSQDALNQLFIEARSLSKWQDKPVSADLLKDIYDLAKLGPTSANCQPLRIVFVASPDGKAKLKDCLFEGNVEQTMTAPVTALFAYDMTFYERLPELFPFVDARPWFTQSEHDTFTHSFRNASLQAAYFMLAARAKGLDCGPMSGFMGDKVNDLFFKGTHHVVNFMCNLGYGDRSSLHPRLMRLDFEATCAIV